MRKLLLASLLTTALVTSCTEDLNVGNSHTASLNASVSVEQTRAAFLQDGSFYWSAGDQIGILTDNGNGQSTAFSALGLKTGAGQASATFEGTIVGNVGQYAVYPYSRDHRLNGTTLSYVFPTEYSYTKVDQTYFPEQKDGNSFNPAMWSTISDNSIAFRHLGGVFCVEIEEMPIASGTLILSADQNMTGKFTTDITAAIPTLVNTEANVEGAGKQVAIKFTGAETGKPAVFYVPVPIGSYDTYVTLKDGDTEKLYVVGGNFNIKRAGLQPLVLKKVTIDAGVATEVENASDVSNALATSDNVSLKGEVTSSSNNEISVPAVQSGAENNPKTISLENVADNASMTVNDANSSSTSDLKSVEKLTVSIPNNADADKAPSITINMPNSTVTLAGNAGTATYREVISSTSQNTLIVSSGVTIKKLIVKKGNVLINKGAVVETIEKASENTDANTCIYYEKGAVIPATVPDGCTALSLNIENESQFVAAMKYGGTGYVLSNDVTLTSKSNVVTRATVCFDMKGNTLSSDDYITAENGGKLTFRNGTIKQNAGGINVDTNGSLIVDNINYEGIEWCALFAKSYAQNASITVTNSKIKGGYYAVTTNAGFDEENPIASNCTIVLKNSSIIADESALAININADVTIEDCKISGFWQAALLRGGNYKISGTTFTLLPTMKPSNSGNKWLTAWSGGNNCAYAALTLGNYENSAYQYPTKVTFTGTNKAEVASGDAYPYAASYPAIHVCANAATDLGVTITGIDNIQAVSAKKPSVEYGTTNIIVDGSPVTPNISATK